MPASYTWLTESYGNLTAANTAGWITGGNKQAEGNSVCCQLAVWWDGERKVLRTRAVSPERRTSRCMDAIQLDAGRAKSRNLQWPRTHLWLSKGIKVLCWKFLRGMSDFPGLSTTRCDNLKTLALSFYNIQTWSSLAFYSLAPTLPCQVSTSRPSMSKPCLYYKHCFVAWFCCFRELSAMNF